jgi:hypothetical protein
MEDTEMSDHSRVVPRCCLCGEDFLEYGNNPEPFCAGMDDPRCCDDCNDRFVVPVRMILGRGYDDAEVLGLLHHIAMRGKTMVKVREVARNHGQERMVEELFKDEALKP